MPELLIVPTVGTSPTLAISDEAQRVKDGLLISAKPIQSIASERTRDVAIRIAGNIKAHLKAVEASRKEVKQPFLDVSRDIDSVAGTHRAELELELYRINRLVGEFEEDRQKRLRTLTDTAAATPPQDASDEQRGEALAKSLEAEEALSNAESAKPTGGALRKDWDIEVTDIKALYAAHPQCVELTARNLAIKDLLKTGITPAGVRATPKVSYAARAATNRLPQ